MTQSSIRKTALAFLDAYSDPDIEKRLYFDVWADRVGLDVGERHPVWREVRQFTYHFAAQKREATRRRNAAARSLFVGVTEQGRGVGPAVE